MTRWRIERRDAAQQKRIGVHVPQPDDPGDGGDTKPKGKRPADSTAEREDWAELKVARADFDQVIASWAGGLSNDWLQKDLTWFSGAANREVTKPRWLLVTHMFNHQTHHRGQVHCMLTQCGVKPGATDLPFQRV